MQVIFNIDRQLAIYCVISDSRLAAAFVIFINQSELTMCYFQGIHHFALTISYMNCSLLLPLVDIIFNDSQRYQIIQYYNLFFCLIMIDKKKQAKQGTIFMLRMNHAQHNLNQEIELPINRYENGTKRKQSSNLYRKMPVIKSKMIYFYKEKLFNLLRV